MTDSHGPTLVAASHEAFVAWRNAGIAVRTRVLCEAGEALARRRAELDEGLVADGLSRALATYYGNWIVDTASPRRLRRYADGRYMEFASSAMLQNDKSSCDSYDWLRGYTWV